MKRNIIIFILVVSHLTSFSQESEKHINQFFDIYQSKGISIALDNLFSSNPWLSERSKDNIENIKSQLQSSTSLMGQYRGNEQVFSRKLGTCLIQYVYIVKFERQPLRFSFIFYKSLDSWSLLNFRYDDNLSEDLEEYAKLHYLGNDIIN